MPGPRASQRFVTEIKRSHTVISYVDVFSPTNEFKRLPFTEGSVKVDKTASVRRSFTGTCLDLTGDITPDDPTDLLTPFGTTLRPYRGVVYADTGEVEVMPLGVFRLSKSSVNDSSGGVFITLEAYDLSRTVSRDKFADLYVIPSGTNLVQAIKDLLARTFDDLQYDAISTTLVTTQPIVYDTVDDPWAKAGELATSLGCELYFDVDGWVVIAPPVDINALPTPDFTYVEGQGTTLLSLGKVFSDEPGYNGVILIGESPGDELPPVRSVAWDEDPTSATYHLGPYGEVPQSITDQNIKTQEDADATAAQLVKNLLGFSYSLSVTSWVNPALEAGNVVQVERAKSKVTGLFAVDAFDVPLASSGTQSLVLRAKRSTA
jgi:hypothetical protein